MVYISKHCSSTATSLDIYAEAALVAAQAANLVIQKAYIDLATDYYTLYNNQRIFYYQQFQDNTNGERGLLDSTMAILPYTPQYTAQAANVEVFSQGNDFNLFWWNNRASMYHSRTGALLNNAYGVSGFPGEPEDSDIALIISDFDTYEYRYEEHRKDFLDERRWEWQNQSLNFGVKQASISQSGLATSFPFIDRAMGTAADWFATQANGLAKFGGYSQALASEGGKLSATAAKGRALAFSQNLGVDRTPAQTFGVSDETGYMKPQPTTSTQPTMFETVQ